MLIGHDANATPVYPAAEPWRPRRRGPRTLVPKTASHLIRPLASLTDAPRRLILLSAHSKVGRERERERARERECEHSDKQCEKRRSVSLCVKGRVY